MTCLSEYIALEINEHKVSLSEAMRFAKWRGQFGFIDDAIDMALIRQAAVEQGIRVSNEEFQQAGDSFRAERELYDAEATEDWLAANHLSHGEWEFLLEEQIIKQKLRDVLTCGNVEKYFAEQRLTFDSAAISRIVLNEEGIARELRVQIVEENADFHTLAREHSLDLSAKPAGGYRGLMRRVEMEPQMEAAVFGAQAGKTVGPIKTFDGWELVKIEALHPATLDGPMRETIKSILFNEWLAGQRVKATIRIPLLEQQAREFRPTQFVT